MHVIGLYLIVVAGYHLWRATFYNFALEGERLSIDEMGLVFALASVPGLLAATVGQISRYVPLYALIGLAAYGLGLGLVALSFSQSLVSVAGAVLAISAGFTAFYPAVHDLTAEAAARRIASQALGNLKCFGALAGVLVAGSLSLNLVSGHLEEVLVITGMGVLLAGTWLVRDARRQSHGARRGRLRFVRELWPYYGLNFLAGARSVLFKTLVLVQLVSKFGFSAGDMALVLVISHLASATSYAASGWLAARIHARTLLTWLYLLVGIVFFGFEHVGPVGFVVLVLADSLLFGVSTITDAHLRSSCPRPDIIGQLAVGLTCFHLAGVLVPLALAAMPRGEISLTLSIAGIVLAVGGVALSRCLGSIRRTIAMGESLSCE